MASSSLVVEQFAERRGDVEQRHDLHPRHAAARHRPAEGTDRAPAKGTSEEVLVQYTVCCTVGVHCVPVSPITHHQPYAYRAALAIALRSWRRSKFQSPLSLAVRFVIRGQLDSGRKFRFCSLGSCLVGARCSDCSSPPTGLLSCTITFTLYGCDQGQASTSPQMHKSMRQARCRSGAFTSAFHRRRLTLQSSQVTALPCAPRRQGRLSYVVCRAVMWCACDGASAWAGATPAGARLRHAAPPLRPRAGPASCGLSRRPRPA